MGYKFEGKLIVSLIIFFSIALSQVEMSWITRYNGPEDSTDIPTGFILDGQDNLYVTGYSQGHNSSDDFATIKYSTEGETVWVKRFNGSENINDRAYAIGKDDSGFIYVSGLSTQSNFNFTLIKYTPDGDTVWTRSPESTGAVVDLPTKLSISLNGSIYIAGTVIRAGTGEDYITIKYTSDGEIDWINIYDGNNGIDRVTGLATDDSGNVIVTGYSYGSGSGYDYATVKYNPAGETVWTKRYNGSGNNHDYVRAIAVDNIGNVYVRGESRSISTRYDYITIKYAPDGDSLWVSNYNGAANNDDFATAITIDNLGNVFVTGYGMGNGTYYDYATVKYSNQGEFCWAKRYDGPSNSLDRAKSIATDYEGNVYVTGASEGSGTQFDFCTIKYNTNGDTIWQMRYDAGINDIDEPVEILVDATGNVYVTGFSASESNDFDYITIKYRPTVGINQKSQNEQQLSISPKVIGNKNSYICINLPEKTRLSLSLFSLNGELKKTMIAGNFNPGKHKIDMNLAGLSSGVYFYRFQTPKVNMVKKIILLR